VIGWLRPAALLVDGAHRGESSIADCPLVDLADAAPTAGEDRDLSDGADLDAPALILFTSGTTGEPKGVVLSFRAILARTALNRAHLPESVLARTLCVLPTHFGHGLIGNCLTPLLGGNSLYLYSVGDIRAIGRTGEVIDNHWITFMSSVPAFWRIARKASRRPNDGSLRRVHIGSAPLSSALWQGVIDWSGTDDVVNAYGITETANWVGGISARDHAPEDGLIGSPWGGAMGVRDEDGVIHATGEGEIVVQSAALFSGYHRRPDLTAAAMTGGWYRTGDLGTIDQNGLARLRGREKEEINRAGIKINPSEIDLLLDRHPDITEACAFPLPDAVSGEAVAVCVRWQDGATASIEDLRGWCETRIRREAVPEHWYEVDEIPKTERGKTDRRMVRDACLRKANNS
jgi:acyl-CoA synthetase (AMP-forming)/AMP-acid ligase II